MNLKALLRLIVPNRHVQYANLYIVMTAARHARHPIIFWSAIAFITLALPQWVVAASPTIRKIPLRDGLILVSALSSPKGDRENVVTVSGSVAKGVHYTWDLARPDAAGKIAEQSFSRYVRAADLARAQRLNSVFRSDDRTDYPGYTAWSLSTSVYARVRESGEAPFAVTTIDKNGAFGSLLEGTADATQTGENAAGFLAGVLTSHRVFKGSLSRSTGEAELFPLLVNGQRVTVPALRLKGQFAFRGERREQDFWVLDDGEHPLILKVLTGGDVFQMVRIDLPDGFALGWDVPEGEHIASGPGTDPQFSGTDAPGSTKDGTGVAREGIGSGKAASASVEQTLDSKCRVEIPGVYFSFGTANLQRTSHRALAAVAQMLTRHPQWSLSIEGHTDDVGTNDANQALSEARASAVRTYLTGQLGIVPARLRAGGFGESKPRETNSTIEGRARNRRVEMVRPCVVPTPLP
jgi:outer membrane protein OmpA-like peptidoglycan-associated protein